jgi:hypothetical protein
VKPAGAWHLPAPANFQIFVAESGFTMFDFQNLLPVVDEGRQAVLF